MTDDELRVKYAIIRAGQQPRYLHKLIHGQRRLTNLIAVGCRHAVEFSDPRSDPHKKLHRRRSREGPHAGPVPHNNLVVRVLYGLDPHNNLATL